MTTIIKTAIVACGFVAAVSAPLTAGAYMSVFSGKDAYVNASGSDGPLSIYVWAFENASKSKSDKTKQSGANGYISYYYDNYPINYRSCWLYGSTTPIAFNAAGGKPPKNVTASGEIPMAGYCFYYDYGTGDSSYEDVTDTLTFNVDASALGDEASRSWGTAHNEYGPYKQNYHYDYSSAPAALNGSSLTSLIFGSVTPNYGYVGVSKSHDVDITR